MKKFLILVFALFVTPFIFAGWVWLQIPSENEIKGCIKTKLFKIDLCPENKNYVRLKDISPYLAKTVVVTEDSLFWQHKGFDWESIKRNYEENKKLGRYKRGGSTITQQLAKNLYLTADKTMIRKGLEALITMKIERILDKKQILERYLNVIEFGKDVYGVKAASQHYFKKHPRNLTIVESAFLAMVLPNPKKYAVSYYKKSLTPFAAKRIQQIVDNMYKFKKITDDEYNMALVELETFFRPAEVLAESINENAEETSTDETPSADATESVQEQAAPEEEITLEALEEEAAEEDRF